MKKLFTLARGVAVAAALMAASPMLVQAADFPDHPVRGVIGMEPGGSHDYLLRSLGPILEKKWGHPVVVENRSGADGRIGMSTLARAKPDGYTIGIGTITDAIHPSLFKDIPYDISKDFQPVSLIAYAPFVLVVGPALDQIKSATEFVEYARKHPGEVTYGSSGVGSPFHLGMAQMAAAKGVEMLHVPFRGSAPLATALLGGEVMSAVVPVGPFIKQIEAGKLRALAVLTDKPLKLMPKVPTLNDELGTQGLDMMAWLGVLAPANTPMDIVNKINADIQTIITDPAFVEEKLAPQAYVPMPGTPQDMADRLNQDRAKYAEVIKNAKITVN